MLVNVIGRSADYSTYTVAQNGTGLKFEYDAEILKERVRNGSIVLENMTLTKDNRLVFKQPSLTIVDTGKVSRNEKKKEAIIRLNILQVNKAVI